jgi:hypothetical protein
MWRALRLPALGLAALGVAVAAAPALGSAQGMVGAHLTASYLEPLPPKAAAKTSKASRHASLSPQQCAAELARRKLGVTRWKGFAAGVATPVRVSGDIAGVRFVTPGRKRST